jgi:hypothetical protein
MTAQEYRLSGGLRAQFFDFGLAFGLAVIPPAGRVE